jgi:hypothetical protein
MKADSLGIWKSLKYFPSNTSHTDVLIKVTTIEIFMGRNVLISFPSIISG